MHLSIAATLLACAAGHAQAFSDSAPFILFSTAEYVSLHPLPKLPSPSSPAGRSTVLTTYYSSRLPPASITAQLQTNNQVLASAKELLASCPTSRYVLLSQPNLHAADIRDNDNHDGNGCRMPNLCRTIGEKHVYGVAEVIGQVSGKPLGEYITKVCGEKGKAVDVERVEMKHLPAVAGKEEGRRGEVLADNGMEHSGRGLLGAESTDFGAVKQIMSWAGCLRRWETITRS
jgi:hypothetical protein